MYFQMLPKTWRMEPLEPSKLTELRQALQNTSSNSKNGDQSR